MGRVWRNLDFIPVPGARGHLYLIYRGPWG